MYICICIERERYIYMYIYIYIYVYVYICRLCAPRAPVYPDEIPQQSVL